MKSKAMKPILSCIIICLSLMLLASCSSVEYYVEYLTDTGVNAAKDDITLITSEDELREYMSSPRFSEAQNNVIQKMESYSSDFFADKMLVVINLKETSGSNKITVRGVDYTDSTLTVRLNRKAPAIADDSIKTWSIFIELDAREVGAVKYTFS